MNESNRERNAVMRILVIAGLALGWGIASAQDGNADVEATFEMVRSFMENEREVMIEEELRLTDTEAEGFWPVYKAYRTEIDVFQDRYASLIAEYADNYGDLSAETAEHILDELTPSAGSPGVANFRA